MKRPCPKCGSVEMYFLSTRNISRCKQCKHNFSETSGTIWHASKMSAEQRQKIIKASNSGKNIFQISKDFQVQYKTVWNIVRKHEVSGGRKIEI